MMSECFLQQACQNITRKYFEINNIFDWDLGGGHYWGTKLKMHELIIIPINSRNFAPAFLEYQIGIRVLTLLRGLYSFLSQRVIHWENKAHEYLSVFCLSPVVCANTHGWIS